MYISNGPIQRGPHQDAVHLAIRNRVPYTLIYFVGRPVTFSAWRLPADVLTWIKGLRRKHRAIIRKS